MKSIAIEPRAPGRRRFLRQTAGLSALVAAGMVPGMAYALTNGAEPTFVLSGPGRAQEIRRRVSAALASDLCALADAGLARPLHTRAVVHTQGLLPHEQDRDASVLAQEDWRQTLTQALAWCVSGKPEYAAKAVAYLEAWLGTYASAFDPIDEADLVDLLFGYDLLQAQLPAALVEQAKTLGRQLASGYLGERRVGDPSTGLNNWQSHRVKLATAGAYLAGDPELIAAAHDGFAAHVTRNVALDGATYDFAQRDAMHYVVYDLEPLLVAASIAAAHGDDWYAEAPLRARLSAALQWLAPYAGGARQHQEFVHSTVRFDARRAAANVPGYAGLWQREESSDLYWIAARLDPSFMHLAQSLDAQPVVRVLYA